MRLVYDINTLSLERTALLLYTNNTKYLRKYSIFGKLFQYWEKKAFIEFQKDFAELFGSRQVSRMFENSVLQTMMWNKINTFLPSLYYTLKLNIDSEVREYYKELFNKYPQTADDLYLILQEQKRLLYKYKEMFEVEKPENKQVTDFEKLIVYVEDILGGKTIPRSMKCYQFKYYYDLAMKKANG